MASSQRDGCLSVQTVIHGTTLVTNAIIERKGDRDGAASRPAAIVTRWRSAASTGMTCTTCCLEVPKPLVPRLPAARGGRADAGGRLGPAAAGHGRRSSRWLAQLARRGIRAIAVSLLHAYQNPEHERQIGRVIATGCAGAGNVALVGGGAGDSASTSGPPRRSVNVYVKSLVRPLSGRTAAQADATSGIDGRTVHDALVRRHRDRRDEPPVPGAPARVGPGSRRAGDRAPRRRRGLPRSDVVRHGRDDGEAVHHRATGSRSRRHAARGRPRLPVQEGLRASR